ncbi:Uncharacterized protein HI_1028, partial [Durusdinium trenchii]
MKPELSSVFGLTLAVTVLASGLSAQTTLRVAGNFPEEHTATGAMQIFKEEVEALTNGEILVQNFPAVSLPFLFDSREKAFEVMDGEVGDVMDAALLEEGFVNLGYMELGFRHATNSARPLT